MNINIFQNNFKLDVQIKKNIQNLYVVQFNNWNDYSSHYLTNLVFPENNSNIWLNLSIRPFKICPISKNNLYFVSNNSILNICVFNQFNKLVGFVVISDKKDFFWIDIFCTNIGQKIGSLIDNLIKLILISKPIRLESTFNSKPFYLKKGFKILDEFIMEYK